MKQKILAAIHNYNSRRTALNVLSMGLNTHPENPIIAHLRDFIIDEPYSHYSPFHSSSSMSQADARQTFLRFIAYLTRKKVSIPELFSDHFIQRSSSFEWVFKPWLQDFIQSDIDLINFLKKLPESVCLSFAIKFRYLIRTAFNLPKVLETLSPESTIEFIYHPDMRRLILDGYVLHPILNYLPEHARLKFIKDHARAMAISGTAQFKRLLDKLPESAHHELINLTARHGLIKNYYDLKEVLDWLPLELRAKFFTEHHTIIKDVYQLSFILSKLQITDYYPLLNLPAIRALIRTGEDLIHILKSLSNFKDNSSRDLQVKFAMDHVKLITDDDQLLPFLRALPEESRYDFVNLPSIRKLINDPQRYTRVNEDCLGEVLKLLPATKCFDLAYSEDMLMLLKGESDKSSWILRYLLNNSLNLSDAQELKSHVKNISHLQLMLDKLPVESRYLFLNSDDMRALIPDAYELAKIIEKLPAKNCLDFVDSPLMTALIQNGQDLLHVLRSLSSELRLDYAVKMIGFLYKKGDFFWANMIVSALPIASRIDFANSLVTYSMKSGIWSINPVSFLPKSSQIIFMNNHHHVINSYEKFQEFTNQLEHPLNNLSKRDRNLLIAPVLTNPIYDLFFVLNFIDINAILFATATDPDSGATFEFFLKHPMSSLDSVNERGHSLEMGYTQVPSRN